MTNEEMVMHDEIETKEDVVNYDNFDYEEEKGSSGIAGAVVKGILAAAVVGGGALIYKNRQKLEERKIKKLEKKGYVIYKPTEVVDEE